MKKILLLIASVIVSTGFAQPFESFNFLGAVNANGWATHSGATPGQVQTISTPSNNGSSLSFANLEASVGNRVQLTAGNTEDVNKAAANLGTSAYFSFLLNVPSTTGLHINANAGDYFTGFGATAGASVTSIAARVFIKAGSSPNTFVLGLTNNSGTGTNTTWNPMDYPCGTTVFVVVKLNISAAPIAASMWVNPTPGTPEPAATILNSSGANPLAALASVYLRQGGTAATGTGTLEIDEFRVGTTWTSVTPCAAPTTYYQDLDGDSFGNSNTTVLACFAQPGLVLNNQDCNDNNAAINPNTVWYADADGDGFGNIAVTQTTCIQPNGYVANNTDCNDNNALANVVTTWYADTDGDGYGNAANSMQNCGQPAGYVANSTDCNDASAAINPAAVEIYNGIDDNCNNSVDEGFTPVNYYLDNDGDGVGGNTFVLGVTSPGANYVLITGDCNDNSAVMYPGNTETCDNLDNDCDASVDEGLIYVTYFQDSDGDNYGNVSVTLSSCNVPQGYVLDSTDCNDQNSAINPGALDIPGNGIDEDCSGLDAPIVAAQLGIYEFTQPSGCPVLANTVTTQPANASFSIYTNVGGSCTAAANVFNNNTWNTGAVVDPANYNEFSIQADSCFGLTLTKLTFTNKVSNVNTIPTWHLRSSLDNFAADIASDSITTNAVLNDTVLLGAAFSNVNQVTFRFYITGISTTGATWRNDNVSLWGFINSVQPQTFYADTDGDGFGDAANTLLSCTLPAGYSTNNTDCDDSNAQINPNTIWFLDTDQDGYGDPTNFTTSCLTPPGTVLNGDDCDDTNAQLNLVDMYYVDADGDGFGDEATGVETCAQPANTVTVGGDCDDANDQIYPGATEICDNEDNNCDGNTDEGLATYTLYEDMDSDGFGSQVSATYCDSIVAGWSLITGDCIDTNDQVYPGATEVLDNGIDENCDGFDNYAGLTDVSVLSMALTPNPSEGDVTITVSTNEQFELIICDVTGKCVLSLKNIVSGTSVSTRSWAPGTYLVTLRQNQQQIVSKLMVK